jgi:hypothetical protein
LASYAGTSCIFSCKIALPSVQVATSHVIDTLFPDRTEAGLTPRFVNDEPPSDADIADVVRKISRRVIRFTRPWSDGTIGIKLSPLELLEKLAAIVPLPRVYLVRYGGCLAPHSTLRNAIIPTPRQQGVDGDEAKTGTPYWSWTRLLGRVFDLDMGTCPFCRRGSLQIIAAITQESVITRILRHLNLASVHPPLPPPVVAKKYSLSTKPTTSCVVS